MVRRSFSGSGSACPSAVFLTWALTRVQRVLMPDSGAESWTVRGDDHVPVAPIERYLAWGEKSPNTVKAYAHDLKDWFVYLGGRGLDWRSATLEDVAGFVGWLRLPPHARDGDVHLPLGERLSKINLDGTFCTSRENVPRSSKDPDRSEGRFDCGDLEGQLVCGQCSEQSPRAGHDRASAVCELRGSR